MKKPYVFLLSLCVLVIFLFLFLLNLQIPVSKSVSFLHLHKKEQAVVTSTNNLKFNLSNERLNLETSFNKVFIEQNSTDLFTQKTQYITKIKEIKKDKEVYLKVQNEPEPTKNTVKISTDFLQPQKQVSIIIKKKILKTNTTKTKQQQNVSEINISEAKSNNNLVSKDFNSSKIKTTKLETLISTQHGRVLSSPFEQDSDSKSVQSCELEIDFCGDGTLNNPYQIFSSEQLNNIRLKNLSATYLLQNNIDLEDILFEPIGDHNTQFLGVFDGNRYKIENLSLSGNYQNRSIGLFGVIGDGGEVRDLFLENVEILADSSYTGILVGETYGAFISNIFVSGEISGASIIGGVVGKASYSTLTHLVSFILVNSSYEKCAGLVGELEYSNLLFSSSSGNITCAAFSGGLVSNAKNSFVAQSFSSAYMYVDSKGAGGLVSSLTENSVLADSFFSGTIEVESALVGGLVSTQIESVIERSYSTGVLFSFDAKQKLGGLIGEIDFNSQFKDIIFLSQENKYDPVMIFSEVFDNNCALDFNYSQIIDELQLYPCFLSSQDNLNLWRPSWRIDHQRTILPLLEKTPGIQFISPTLYVYSISKIPSILLLETLVHSFFGYAPITKGEIKYFLKEPQPSGFSLSPEGVLSIDHSQLVLGEIVLTVKVFTPFFDSMQDINVLLYD